MKECFSRSFLLVLLLQALRRIFELLSQVLLCLTWIQMSRMMSVMSSINGHYCCVCGPRTADINVETRCSHARLCLCVRLCYVYAISIVLHLLLSTMRCALSAMTTATTTTTTTTTPTTNGVVVDVVDGVDSVKC